MAYRALVLALCLASAQAAFVRSGSFLATDHGDRMRPEVVANTLARVEDEWKAQATTFAECHTGDCGTAPDSFARSCSTVVNAVVQGSGGDRDVAKEYMANVCGQKMLQSWHKLRCQDLAGAIIDQAMGADNYANREMLKPAKLCTGFWSKFVAEEQKREAEEAKAKAEREKKEAAERAAREKKEAEEAAAANKKAEEEAKAKAKKEAEEKAKREQEEKAQHAKEEAAKAKALAAEAAAKLAQKKAEAAETQKAAQEKLEEAEKAEKEHQEHVKKQKEAEENLKQAAKAAGSKATAKTTKAEAGEVKAAAAKEVKADAKEVKATSSGKAEKPAAAKATAAPQAKRAADVKKEESAVKSPVQSPKKF